jgi:hypothetical protein
MDILVIDDKRIEHGESFFENYLKLEVDKEYKHKYDIEVDSDSKFGIQINTDANSLEELEKNEPRYISYEKMIDLENKKMMILNNENMLYTITFQSKKDESEKDDQKKDKEALWKIVD